jgi:hypothetical protein
MLRLLRRNEMPRFPIIRALAAAVSKAQMLAIAVARQKREKAKATATARVAYSEAKEAEKAKWGKIIERHAAMAAKAEAERADRANAKY